jgi:hypothetical protein
LTQPTTDDSYLIKQISLPSCQTCKRWIGIVDGYVKQGAYAKGGRLTIGECKLVEGSWDVKSDYVVDCKFTQAPVAVIYKNGQSSTQASKPTSQGSYVFVSWVNGGWKIVEEEADS